MSHACGPAKELSLVVEGCRYDDIVLVCCAVPRIIYDEHVIWLDSRIFGALIDYRADRERIAAKMQHDIRTEGNWFAARKENTCHNVVDLGDNWRARYMDQS